MLETFGEVRKEHKSNYVRLFRWVAMLILEIALIIVTSKIAVSTT